jgi:hypothetical protein
MVTLSPPTHSYVATLFLIKYPAQWNNSHFLSYHNQWWPFFITSPQYPIVITRPSILTPSGGQCPSCQNGGFQSADGSFGEGEAGILGPKISHLGFYSLTLLEADLQVRCAAGRLGEGNQSLGFLCLMYSMANSDLTRSGSPGPVCRWPPRRR